MKNRFLLILLLFAQIAYSQTLIETRTASLVPGGYPLEGTVYLELFDDGALNLRFDSDYLTQSNVFDVHVFLSNSDDYSAPIDTSGMLLVENIGTISGLDYSSGPMTFNLPAGVGINDYQYIVFVCVQFGRLNWGNGAFSESVVVTNTTEAEASEKPLIHIYPNPSATGIVEVNVQNPQQNMLLDVMNLNGQIIYSKYFIEEQPLLIELKEPGVYFLKLSSNGSATVQKVIRL